MSFKGVLERSGFKNILDTDFCILVQRNDIQYVVFKSIGIRCVNITNFQELSIEQLQYLYNEKMIGEEEEYEFTYSLDKDNLINYLFGLIPFENDLCPGISNASYFGKKLVIKKDENLPALLLSDKDNQDRNVLIFSEDSYRPLFFNKDCFLFTFSSEKEIVIAYNPVHLLAFISKHEIDKYSTVLFLENASGNFLRFPIESHFENYFLLCSNATEYVEALRFIVEYANLEGDKIQFSKNGGEGKVEFFLPEDVELLRYIQLSALMQKTHRKVCGENQMIRTFECKKINILKSKVFSITFNISRIELEILVEHLVDFFKVPIKFILP